MSSQYQDGRDLQRLQTRRQEEYGKIENDEDKQANVASLKNLIRGLKAEAQFKYDELLDVKAKAEAGDSRYGRSHFKRAQDEYLAVVDRVNDAILRLSELTGVTPYLWERRQVGLSPKIPSYRAYLSKGKVSTRTPSSRLRSQSPIRNRGMMSCAQPRDPHTGKFVSRYY